MKKITILFLALLMVGIAYAAIPPYGTVEVFYDSLEITDEQFYAEFLDCVKEDYVPIKDGFEDPTMPLLNISEYNEESDCYWKSFSYPYSSYCTNSTCYFHDLPFGWARFATYIPSMDKLFITDEIFVDSGFREFGVAISQDDIAYIVDQSAPSQFWIIMLTGLLIYFILPLMGVVIVIWIVLRLMKTKKKVKK